MGFPGGTSSKEPACQYRRHKRHRLGPWVRKIPLEQKMATHSSSLTWRVPRTEEPTDRQCIGLPRVGNDWSDLAHNRKARVVPGDRSQSAKEWRYRSETHKRIGGKAYNQGCKWRNGKYARDGNGRQIMKSFKFYNWSLNIKKTVLKQGSDMIKATNRTDLQ